MSRRCISFPRGLLKAGCKSRSADLLGGVGVGTRNVYTGPSWRVVMRKLKRESHGTGSVEPAGMAIYWDSSGYVVGSPWGHLALASHAA